VAQDATELGQIQNGQFNLSSPSIYVSVDSPSASPKITMANMGLLSPGHCALSLCSPRTPTKVPRTPTLGGYAMTGGLPAKAARVRPWLALSSRRDLSPCPSPRYPSSASVPSPFRTQLQEDVATTPLPSTPLTAKWPGSAILRSALVPWEELPSFIK